MTGAHPRETAGSAPERFARSVQLMKRGRKILPDGVSSPIRTFGEVGSPPVFVQSARGCRLTDVDGNEYVDLMLGLGPMILGHAHPAVRDALSQQIEHGTVYAAPTQQEYDLAELVIDGTPFADQVRFVCSGTEAVMTAVRLARAATRRTRLVKFANCYHGHSDAVLAGRGADDWGVTASRSIDPSVDATTIVLEYNNADQVTDALRRHGSQVAAVLVEPIACNMGLVAPRREFVSAVRAACDQAGALLIFDEVVTGFRFCYGSVAGLLGVAPDIVTFGKIIGGGTPVGAYAARRDLMRMLNRAGGIFQGGTFAGNPLSMAAGIATLREIRKAGFYERLDELGEVLETQLVTGFRDAGLPHNLSRYGSAASLGLLAATDRPPAGGRSPPEAYSELHLELMRRGFLLPPSIDEPLFLSAAHSESDVKHFASAVVDSLARLV